MNEEITKHLLRGTEPTVEIKLTRNTHGYQWEITVTEARSATKALDIIKTINRQLEKQYPKEKQSEW